MSGRSTGRGAACSGIARDAAQEVARFTRAAANPGSRYHQRSTGRGAAWLARLSGGQEVPGSNPGAPTREKPRSGGLLVPSAAILGLLSWTRSGHERVESCPRPLKRVGKQVAVGAVNLLDARTHEAGELEQRDAGGDPERGEGVPKRVGRAVLEARGSDGRRPGIRAPLVQVQVPAPASGEEETGVEPR